MYLWFPVPGQRLRSDSGQEAEDPGEAARRLEAEVRRAGGRGGGLPEGKQATCQRALQSQDNPWRIFGAAGGCAKGKQGLPGYENTPASSRLKELFDNLGKISFFAAMNQKSSNLLLFKNKKQKNKTF